MERYTFWHTMRLKNGQTSERFSPNIWWKTSYGALKAAHIYAESVKRPSGFKEHVITIVNQHDEFVTNDRGRKFPSEKKLRIAADHTD